MLSPAALRLCSIAATALLGLARLAAAQCPGHWSPSVSAPGVAGGPARFERLVPLPNGDVAVSGNFATIGGAASNGLAIYHPGSDTWTTVGGGPWWSIGAGPGGTIVGVSGGQIAGFDPATNTVNILAALPAGVCGGPGPESVAATPDGAFFAGFYGANNFCNSSVLRREPSTGVWGQVYDAYYGECLVDTIAVLPNSGVAVLTMCTWEPSSCCFETDFDVTLFSSSSGTWSRALDVTNIHYNAFGIWGLLVLPNNDLIIGGEFTLGASPVVRRVARYDHQSGAWSPLGDGPASSVYRLAALTNGDIVASTANGLFRYRDGTAAWSPIQPALVGVGLINAMLVLPGGDLLVAGYSGSFSSPTPLLARYVFSSPQQLCPADFNCSTHLEVQDIFDFLTAWFALDPRADFNGLNGITTQDIFDFLAAWFAGC